MTDHFNNTNTISLETNTPQNIKLFKIINIRRPYALTELTPIIFYMELSLLVLEASIYDKHEVIVK